MNQAAHGDDTGCDQQSDPAPSINFKDGDDQNGHAKKKAGDMDEDMPFPLQVPIPSSEIERNHAQLGQGKSENVDEYMTTSVETEPPV